MVDQPSAGEVAAIPFGILTAVSPRVRPWQLASSGDGGIDPAHSKVLGIAPVLVVYPLMQAVDFYQNKLGFRYPQFWGDPPAMAVLERDGCSLYLYEADFEITISPSGGWDLRLCVEDLQAEYRALEARQVSIASGPVEVVTGLRKETYIEVVDPNGYCICILQQTWLTRANRSRTGS